MGGLILLRVSLTFKLPARPFSLGAGEGGGEGKINAASSFKKEAIWRSKLR